MIFLQSPCLVANPYTDFVDIPIEVSDSCFATCPVNTTVTYLCDEFGSASTGEAWCTEAYTWHINPPLETCIPTDESKVLYFY